MKKRRNLPSRLCALLLAAVLLCSLGVPQAAAADPAVTWSQVDGSAVTAQLPLQKAEEEAAPAYRDTETVRVSIFLEDAPTISKFDVQNIAENQAALAYRSGLETRQETLAQAISTQALGGKQLDVVWNLTLAANIISANVEYGEIAAIEQVPGVQQVLLETQYAPAVVDTDLPNDPNMSTSSAMIGSSAAWAAGYTGAGSRIAVIDTGTDTDHQSFSAAGFDYSLAKQAEQAGKTVADYNLLDVEEITGVLDQLHVGKGVTALQLYRNTKLPFGYNYIDKDLDITHDQDRQGEHGSHVAGIATANAYIPNADGTFAGTLDSVKVQGVAPDAQLITMKVFGKAGGAYDSDYLAAIEDAIVLKCDVVNLSLGSSNPGEARHAKAEYQAILDRLAETGMVVSISAGNAGSWVESAQNAGYLYSDDVNMDMVGSPGSYTNSLCVASIDNAGATGEYFLVGDTTVVYTQSTGFRNQPLASIAGEHEYVLIDGFGTEEDFAAVADVLEGKVAVCSRGDTSFFQKAEAAVANGAIATIVYNNQPGIISMDLTDYTKTAPCVSVLQSDGAMMKAAATPVTGEDGKVLYYLGRLDVKEGSGSAIYTPEYNTMSSFSSWGIPGSLELKPEITAPGGNIYSVNGLVAGGTAYENMSGTSMAAPQVAGMAALVAQYIREEGLARKTGLTPRQLAQSLLMSTAVPQMEDYGEDGHGYYPVLRQGAGLANVGKALAADSYILMGEDAGGSYADGKVKVELGDDPERNGTYTFSFSIHNLTNEEKTYALSADFFTQDLFTHAVNNDGDQGDYMDTWTTALDAEVTFDVGQAVTVPANGSKDVQVTVRLTDGQKAALKQYPAGAYIQGYVYAKSGSTEEGVEGTEHSIPVLGFYGSWSEASMFEVGPRVEYDAGAEVRLPYLGNTKVNTAVITYADDPGTKYYFGGNPLVADAGYMPERNAINSENGDQISQISVAVIRNAAASRVLAVNETNPGEPMLESYPGAINSAYYHTNAGSWQNTVTTLNTNFVPTGAQEGDRLELSLTLAPEYYVDAQGNVRWDDLEAGASMHIPMTVDNAAPELLDVNLSLMGSTMTVKARDNRYVAGVVLYNASGTKSLAMTGAMQDIQPGEAADYTLDLAGANGKTFLVKVFDYALNATTYQVKLQTGGDETLPDMMAFQTGSRVWIGFGPEESTPTELTSSEQVYTAATHVDGLVFAATNRGDLYVLSEEDLGMETCVANMGVVLTDMAYDQSTSTLYGVTGNHLVSVDKLTGAVTDLAEIPFPTNTLACDGNGTFYSAVHGDSSEVGNRGFVYAYTLDTLQGGGNLEYDFDGDGKVNDKDGQAILDYVTGVRDSIQNAAHADLDGNGELTSRDAYLFLSQFRAGAFGAAPQQITSKTRDNVKTLAWNPNDGQLYAVTFSTLRNSSHAYFYSMNPETGAETMYKDFRTEITSLIIPQKTTGGSWTTPTDEISGVQVAPQSMTLLKGSRKTLSARVQPWTATDRTVTWTSANPEIATVDADGVVTGVSAGETVITVASKLDPQVTATCSVTVDALDVTLKGALQDGNGSPMLFSWNMETDDNWVAGLPLSSSLAAVAYDKVTDRLYLQDSVDGAWFMHQVDLTTGQDTAKSSAACGFGFAMSDLVALENFNTKEEPGMMAVSQTYLMSACDPLGNTFNQGWDLTQYLTEYTGGAKFVAVASMGTETNEEGVLCDLIYALDDAGYLWSFQYDGSSSISFNFIPTDLTSLKLRFPTYQNYQYCSLVCGDDGNLYLSYFTGETNEFYRLSWNAEEELYAAERIGDVGIDVWPAALYAVETNAAAEQVAVTGMLEKPLTLEAQPMRAAAPMSQVTPQEDGKTVTLTITAKDGQGVEVDSNNGLITVSYDKAALELQEAAVTGDYTAQVTVAGTVTLGYVSEEAIAAGSPVATLTFTLKSGADSVLTVQHREINDGKPAYTEKLTVDLECPSEAFMDLDPNRWYHAYTDYVIANGLMNGVEETRFAPNASITRGQLVTTLYRLAGEPEVEGTSSFTDVDGHRFYAEPIAWAEEQGIVHGVTPTTFRPEASVTREQAATFLYRYVTEYLKLEAAEGADLKDYADGDKVMNYAKTAFAWAVAEGLFEGYEDGMLRPAATLTRAQMAKLLTILDQNF